MKYISYNTNDIKNLQLFTLSTLESYTEKLLWQTREEIYQNCLRINF